jgi:hypothetical protein
MAETLSDLQVAAALSELSYSRDKQDQSLTVGDVGGTNLPLGSNPAPFPTPGGRRRYPVRSLRP